MLSGRPEICEASVCRAMPARGFMSTFPNRETGANGVILVTLMKGSMSTFRDMIETNSSSSIRLFNNPAPLANLVSLAGLSQDHSSWFQNPSQTTMPRIWKTRILEPTDYNSMRSEHDLLMSDKRPNGNERTWTESAPSSEWNLAKSGSGSLTSNAIWHGSMKVWQRSE